LCSIRNSSSGSNDLPRSKRLVTPSMSRSSTTFVVATTPELSPCGARAELQRATIPRQQARRGDVEMLVDSSVWIAYLRGDHWVEVEFLSEALEQGAPVWLAPPILQEVLQGADSPARFTRWDRVLGELPMVIAPDSREAARSAAHLYTRCRWAGVTPRSATDCLIATHAILGGMPLLHRDRDFDLIAEVEPKLVLVVVEQ
jgi:predicted nucleic acid-binding protein